MLGEISYLQLLEWNAFDSLEPFGEEREDYRVAAVRQTMVNLTRAIYMKHPTALPLADFLLGFGDLGHTLAPPISSEEAAAARAKHIEMVMSGWVSGHNARLREGGGKILD